MSTNLQKLNASTKGAGSAQDTNVSKLLAAKRAYFSGEDSGLTDAEYDQLEALVLRENPEAAAEISATGWAPAGATHTLPFIMPSLDKGKPGEEPLARFLADKTSVVISEKLDGVSALFDIATGRLYNRGDGVTGVELTAFIPQITGISKAVIAAARAANIKMVRGEILLRKADADPTTPARSQVNGALHRHAGDSELPMRFLAYQICEPATLRVQHFRQLAAVGFEVPWNKGFTTITEPELATLLQERKVASEYDIDGLVLAKALIKPPAPECRADGKPQNPKDAIAFKMPLDEQQARTTILEVEWNCSRFNVYAPRIRIEPVRIGGALITYVTGHNAKHMVTNGLGVGAEVTILRSGDVIPIIYQVHKKVPVKLPSTTWDATETNVLATEASAEQITRHLEHALAILEVDGAGPAAAAALVENELTTIQDILEMPATTLAPILGPGKGPQLLERLQAAIRSAPLPKLILATQDVPKGLGRSKLAKLLEAIPNCDKWKEGSLPPAGWSATTWSEFCELWPDMREEIEGWKDQIGEDANLTRLAKAASMKAVAKAAAASKGGVCMSGFRDAGLTDAATTAGYTIDDSVKKSTVFLIVPDKEDPATMSTGKAVKARENGATIMRASDWKKYLANN
jgi:DNA ligase (NAD+)